jgi:hypothetical protein
MMGFKVKDRVRYVPQVLFGRSRKGTVCSMRGDWIQVCWDNGHITTHRADDENLELIEDSGIEKVKAFVRRTRSDSCWIEILYVLVMGLVASTILLWVSMACGAEEVSTGTIFVTKDGAWAFERGEAEWSDHAPLAYDDSDDSIVEATTTFEVDAESLKINGEEMTIDDDGFFRTKQSTVNGGKEKMGLFEIWKSGVIISACITSCIWLVVLFDLLARRARQYVKDEVADYDVGLIAKLDEVITGPAGGNSVQDVAGIMFAFLCACASISFTWPLAITIAAVYIPLRLTRLAFRTKKCLGKLSNVAHCHDETTDANIETPKF